MADIEDIECSIELPIGIRFYFQHTLLEVVESKNGMMWDCPRCALSESDEEELCQVMNCDGHRHDKKHIYFKEVKEAKEENND